MHLNFDVGEDCYTMNDQPTNQPDKGFIEQIKFNKVLEGETEFSTEVQMNELKLFYSDTLCEDLPL